MMKSPQSWASPPGYPIPCSALQVTPVPSQPSRSRLPPDEPQGPAKGFEALAWPASCFCDLFPVFLLSMCLTTVTPLDRPPRTSLSSDHGPVHLSLTDSALRSPHRGPGTLPPMDPPTVLTLCDVCIAPTCPCVRCYHLSPCEVPPWCPEHSLMGKGLLQMELETGQ